MLPTHNFVTQGTKNRVPRIELEVTQPKKTHQNNPLLKPKKENKTIANKQTHTHTHRIPSKENPLPQYSLRPAALPLPSTLLNRSLTFSLSPSPTPITLPRLCIYAAAGFGLGFAVPGLPP